MRRSHRTTSVLFFLVALLSAPLVNAGIIVGNVEWLQPKDVANYSWNDFNAVCVGGSCNGQIGGIGPDLTGWQ